ncbi:MAG: phosphoribosylformylglycinamidine cyclo-ligase [Clostridia bacterium]|nr:phosphoribosylformylglycinamidine cyclo-ligase [Clostridia bacterium]
MSQKIDYKSAGVDIDAGNKAVELMKKHVKSTWGPEVLAELGGFGGFFSLDIGKFKSPVLVAGTDGVGTKLKVAFMADKHDTIGIDAVAMCVNDILVCGATPLFFLDYIALGKMEPEKVALIVKGISEGCKEAGCALIGGETAEMPGMYDENEYDIAGFAVGIVEREKIIDGSRINPGDLIFGLGSSGLHSNGFSLVRKILFEIKGYDVDMYVPDLDCTIAEEILKPTRIYTSSVRKVLGEVSLSGMAHITGGGIIENIARILPEGCRALIKGDSWERPVVFNWLQKMGGIEEHEMYRTFNNGIGLVMIVNARDADKTLGLLKDCGEKTFVIGEVVSGESGVEIL